MGPKQTAVSYRPTYIALLTCESVESLGVWIDDQRIGMVAGADVTRLAVRSVRWLADQLAVRGLTLGRGQVVLTGSLLPLYALKAGRSVVAAIALFGRSSAVIGP